MITRTVFLQILSDSGPNPEVVRLLIRNGNPIPPDVP